MPTASTRWPDAPARAWPPIASADAIDDLVEMRRDLAVARHTFRQVKDELAWQHFVGKAKVVSGLLHAAELSDRRRKANPNWPKQPRVPAGNADGGQWTDGGPGSGAAAAAALSAGLSVSQNAAGGSAETVRQGLQAIGRAAGVAAGVPASAVAAGILMATAAPAGGETYTRTQTLSDGTVVTVRRHENEVHTIVRAESPDGTVTYARISTSENGGAKVLSAATQRPGRDPEELDPAAMSAAASTIIAAATGGGGDKRKPAARPADTVGTPQGPDDFEPESGARNESEHSTTSTNYRETFFKAHTELRGRVNVHHSVEQQVLTNYPGRFNAAEIHSLQNLRGIPNSANSEIHLSRIRMSWSRFYNLNPNATRQQILDHASTLDKDLGRHFAPILR